MPIYIGIALKIASFYYVNVQVLILRKLLTLLVKEFTNESIDTDPGFFELAINNLLYSS